MSVHFRARRVVPGSFHLNARAVWRFAPLGLATALLCGCGGGGGSDSPAAPGPSTPTPSDPAVPPPAAVHYTVGGTVTGLASGQTLVLQNQGADDFTVGANGAFVLAASWPAGSRYALAVKTQPTGQQCTVARGSGTLSAAVTDVAIACETLPVAMYALGGTVSGLAAGSSLVLHTSAGENLPIAADGRFTFTTPLPGGADYTVTVQSGPAVQQCAVRNGTGTMPYTLVDWLSVRCTVPGALPQGLWVQEACQPAGALGPSSRLVFQFGTATADVLNYNSGWESFPSESCPGEGRYNSGPKIGVRTFKVERTEGSAQFAAHWGTSDLLLPYAERKDVWVRKDARLCIIENATQASYPTLASLEPAVTAAIAGGKCYTPY